VTIHIESETDEHRSERCDHDGTTEPLGGLASGVGVHRLQRDLADEVRRRRGDGADRAEGERGGVIRLDCASVAPMSRRDSLSVFGRRRGRGGV
jgi:hypothetical protein